MHRVHWGPCGQVELEGAAYKFRIFFSFFYGETEIHYTEKLKYNRKDEQRKETINNILAWVETEYKEGPSLSKSELPR